MIGCILARPVYRIQRRGGQGPVFDDGGAKVPKSQNSPKIIRVPPYVKTGTSDFGGGHGPPGPPCIPAWSLLPKWAVKDNMVLLSIQLIDPTI